MWAVGAGLVDGDAAYSIGFARMLASLEKWAQTLNRGGGGERKCHLSRHLPLRACCQPWAGHYRRV